MTNKADILDEVHVNWDMSTCEVKFSVFHVSAITGQMRVILKDSCQTDTVTYIKITFFILHDLCFFYSNILINLH